MTAIQLFREEGELNVVQDTLNWVSFAGEKAEEILNYRKPITGEEVKERLEMCIKNFHLPHFQPFHALSLLHKKDPGQQANQYETRRFSKNCYLTRFSCAQSFYVLSVFHKKDPGQRYEARRFGIWVQKQQGEIACSVSLALVSQAHTQGGYNENILSVPLGMGPPV